MSSFGRSKYETILTKEFLNERYVREMASIPDLAREVGCHYQTVESHLRFHNIERRNIADYTKMKKHPLWNGYEDISRTQYNNMKANAKQRKILFDISIEDLWQLYLDQNKKCALSGREIGFVSNRKGNASLDRKDSNKHYYIGNVQWVHKDINYAKQSLNNKEFIQLCVEVSENQIHRVP
jgi:hypothetical protein